MLEKGMKKSLKMKSRASFWTAISVHWQTPLISVKLFGIPTTVKSEFKTFPWLLHYESIICNDQEHSLRSLVPSSLVTWARVYLNDSSFN